MTGCRLAGTYKIYFREVRYVVVDGTQVAQDRD